MKVIPFRKKFDVIEFAKKKLMDSDIDTTKYFDEDDFIKCFNCGQKLKSWYKYCPECGKKLNK